MNYIDIIVYIGGTSTNKEYCASINQKEFFFTVLATMQVETCLREWITTWFLLVGSLKNVVIVSFWFHVSIHDPASWGRQSVIYSRRVGLRFRFLIRLKWFMETVPRSYECVQVASWWHTTLPSSKKKKKSWFQPAKSWLLYLWKYRNSLYCLFGNYHTLMCNLKKITQGPFRTKEELWSQKASVSVTWQRPCLYSPHHNATVDIIWIKRYRSPITQHWSSTFRL